MLEFELFRGCWVGFVIVGIGVWFVIGFGLNMLFWKICKGLFLFKKCVGLVILVS